MAPNSLNLSIPLGKIIFLLKLGRYIDRITFFWLWFSNLWFHFIMKRSYNRWFLSTRKEKNEKKFPLQSFEYHSCNLIMLTTIFKGKEWGKGRKTTKHHPYSYRRSGHFYTIVIQLTRTSCVNRLQFFRWL